LKSRVEESRRFIQVLAGSRQTGKELVAIEVKSGRRRGALPGLAQFSREFDVTRTLLVGADGKPLVEFLAESVQTWIC